MVTQHFLVSGLAKQFLALKLFGPKVRCVEEKDIDPIGNSVFSL
jgi:hypothetical protein